MTAIAVFRAAAALGLVLLAAGAGAHHLYLDRAGVPDLEPFIRFEPPRSARSPTRAARC